MELQPDGFNGAVRKSSLRSTPPQTFQRFPVDRLPEPLAKLVADGAKSIGCDPTLIVLPMLSCLGAAIGNSRRIEIKSDWSASACIWTMVVAESGSAKTPALQLSKSPLEDAESRANDDYEDEAERYSVELADFEQAKKAFAKSNNGEAPTPPTAPTPKRHIVKDTTVAGLVEVMKHNPRGVLVVADELAGWFGAFNRFNNGSGDEAQWLSIYSGEPISVDRKGNRNKLDVPRPTRVAKPFAAITGGIQPGIFLDTITKQHQASGMAARFLMAYPPRQPRSWSDSGVSSVTKQRYADTFVSLLGIHPEWSETGRLQPKLIRMSAEAKRLFVDFYNRHNLEQAERCGTTAAAGAKIEEIPARLALIFHCVKVANGNVEANQVDAESMEPAIVIAEWFMAEAERIYSVMSGNDFDRELRSVFDWIKSRGGTVTASELRRGRRSIDDSESADEVLVALVNAGWGQWEDSPKTKKGGRPTRQFVAAVAETPPTNGESLGCCNSDSDEAAKPDEQEVSF